MHGRTAWAQGGTAGTAQKPAAKKPGATTGAAKPAALVLKDEKDKLSYALGLSMGTNSKENLIDVNPAVVLQGLKDGLSGKKPLMTADEMQATLTKMQADVKVKRAAANLKEGSEFLAANKTKPGVVALPSGLQYKIITEGTGPKPTAEDTVVCNYRGTLIDGKEFDSSYKRGEPASFPVGRVIKGWTEALQLMPVGSKWQLFIPAELAYRDRGAGPDIGPNATLIFEVELISIKGK